jgi:hypothetical protein
VPRLASIAVLLVTCALSAACTGDEPATTEIPSAATAPLSATPTTTPTESAVSSPAVVDCTEVRVEESTDVPDTRMLDAVTAFLLDNLTGDPIPDRRAVEVTHVTPELVVVVIDFEHRLEPVAITLRRTADGGYEMVHYWSGQWESAESILDYLAEEHDGGELEGLHCVDFRRWIISQ